MGFFKEIFSYKECGFVNGGGFEGLKVSTEIIDNDYIIKFFESNAFKSGWNNRNFKFSKNDLKNVTILQSGVEFTIKEGLFKMNKYLGNRYQLEFNDGKRVIVSCPSEQAQYFERAIF